MSFTPLPTLVTNIRVLIFISLYYGALDCCNKCLDYMYIIYYEMFDSIYLNISKKHFSLGDDVLLIYFNAFIKAAYK